MKYTTLAILSLFVSFEVFGFASQRQICKKRGGTWNQWSSKCTYPKKYNYKRTSNSKRNFNSSYNNRYKSNSYKSNSYKSNSYNKYNSKKSYTTYSNKNNTRQPASIKKVALTYCWKTKSGKNWMCDGPTQKLLTGWKDLTRARELVGCSNYIKSRSWNNGKLYECARKLESYDRDIRGRYGISRNY